MGTDSNNKSGSTTSYELECPQCKTTKYRNPQMKLMVNVCGHALCDNCVRTLFIKESGQCPECDMVVKRAKFRIQLFEDPIVEKEIDIRRKVMRVFNKIPEDFDTVEEWDDYLEEIETMVINLTNDIDKLETEKKIETYEKLHREEIKRNFNKRSAADEELLKIIEEEKMNSLQRQQQQKKEMEQHQEEQTQRNASLLKDLMASDGDAAQIVQSHAERLKLEAEGQEQEKLLSKLEARNNPLEFSSGVRIGAFAASSQVSSDVAAKQTLLMQAKEYKYEEPVLPLSLPTPSLDCLETEGYLAHVRQCGPAAKAGGYTEQIACIRALQEFMSGHIL